MVRVWREIVDEQMCARSAVLGSAEIHVVRKRNFNCESIEPRRVSVFPLSRGKTVFCAPPSLEEAPTHLRIRCSAKKNDAGEKRYRCCDVARHGRARGRRKEGWRRRKKEKEE